MKGYRTIVVALLQIVVGIALLLLVPERSDMGMALIAAGATMAGLRVVTDGPVGGEK